MKSKQMNYYLSKIKLFTDEQRSYEFTGESEGEF